MFVNTIHGGRVAVSTTPTKRTLLELIEAECMGAWLEGISIDQAHDDLGWGMDYITYFYAKFDKQVDIQFAALQRKFNAPVTTDNWDIL